MNGFGDYVGFVPGLALAVALAIVLGGRVANWLRLDRGLASVLIVSLGIVLAATVTPSRDAIMGVPQGPASCDLSRFGLAPWSEYRQVNETSLNVLLLVPLGVSIGLMPPASVRLPIVLGGVALPFAIEAVQLLVTPLGRACQSGDVVDNLAGLTLGLAGGWMAATVWRRQRAA